MYPMIHLKWHDASSPNSGWLEKDEFLDHCAIMEAYTCGYLVFEDETQYKVCQSYFPEDEQMSCGIAIPKIWVTSFVYLSVPPGEKTDNQPVQARELSQEPSILSDQPLSDEGKGC